VSGAEATRPNNPLKAILLKVGSIAIFVAMQSFIKLAGMVPAGEIVFYRSFFALFPVLLMLAWRGQLRGAWRTERPLGHIHRGVVGVLSMWGSFFALTRLPLPEAIMLNYAQPLLVIVASALFLGEKVRVYRWTAVVVGFVGVFIICWPTLSVFSSGEAVSNERLLGVVAAIAAAAMSALAMLQVRSLVATEKSATIVLWFSATSSVLALLTIPLGWISLSATQLTFLILCGFCGGIAQVAMTEAYRYASAATVAPFEYSSIIIGSVAGYFLFGDLPTIFSMIGGAIIVLSGLFIIWRERQLGLERAKAEKISPTAG
jgi:drug/metabolite transporter (DMT)-like permease